MNAREGKALLDHGNAIARRYAGQVGWDVAQEIRGEAVLRALASPPPDGRLEPWLERIYRNLLVDFWRRGRVRTVGIAERPELASTGTPEDDVLRRERRRVVRKRIGHLSREARRALLSRYFGELDDRAAAARLGVAPATIRTRIHRALARLRPRLGDLRAWFPPLLGKLGTQAAAIGWAPAMVAALAVIGNIPPEARLPSKMVPLAATVERQPAAPAWLPSAPAPAATTPAPPPRARLARKAALPASTLGPTPPAAPLLGPGPQEPEVRAILQPDGLDIFVEPVRSNLPCLVDAPPDLLAQIDKMIEERL